MSAPEKIVHPDSFDRVRGVNEASPYMGHVRLNAERLVLHCVNIQCRVDTFASAVTEGQTQPCPACFGAGKP